MLFHDTDIPTALVDAAFAESLVIFAGAGVSMQAPLEFPSFNKLVDMIKEDVDPANRLRKRRSSGNKDVRIYSESPEQYLSYLESTGCNIRSACAAHLSTHDQTSGLHSNLMRLFPHEHPVRIVTTNFDNGFEVAANSASRDCPVYCSPALPLGSNVTGVVHLHGSVSDHNSMVLTAEDYGRAYVTIGWSSRFLVDLFTTYTVLFIGYSCGDSLVDYLTRSISSDMSGRAFALCREPTDADSWRIRGVEPVFFRNYEDLPMIVDDWAGYMEQSVTDRVHELRRLGTIKELSPEQCDYVIYSLRWHDEEDRALFASAFCSHSTHFNHLALLHEKGLTNFLCAKEPSKMEYSLLHWAISQFSIGQCKEMQALCLQLHSELSVHFYEQLTWNLVRTDAPPSAIGPWVVWLESAPYHYQARCIHHLAQIASTCDSPDITLAILKMLLKVTMGVSNNPGSGIEPGPFIPISDSYYKKQALDGLKRHKGTIGEKLFDYCFEQIELAYSIQTRCWTNEKVFDGLSFTRSSVETHEQDRHERGAGSTLLDLAKESVQQETADSAAEKCLGSRCNLLVRLGLWIKDRYACDGECLRLVADKGYLENMYLKHEVFQLVRHSFEKATPAQRGQFTSYLEQLYKKEDVSDYERFNMCSWLLSTTDDCELRRQRDDVLSRHPNYRVREHPDFNYYTTCGFMDSTTEHRIPRDEFTIESLLERLQHSAHSQSFFELQDIVSTPAKSYPDLAIEMIADLLSKDMSTEEATLCNLLISSTEWNSPDISRKRVYETFTTALSDKRTCVAGINALALCSMYADKNLEWSQEELARLLLATKDNLPVLLKAKSAIEIGDETDWVAAGINHPAGKYLGLIAKLEHLEHDNNAINSVASSLLKELNILSLTESPTAKALIACFFMKFNTWVACDYVYSKSVAALLADESWAQIPSWQGIAHLSGMSREAWEITADSWDALFRGHIAIGEELHSNLVRLYVWLTIVRANKEDRGRMLKVCGSASDASLQTACMTIGNWLKALDEEEQVLQWKSWLSESFGYLATCSEKSKETLAKCYCRWIRTVPALRSYLSQALIRDCSNLKGRGVFVHEGTLKAVVTDSNLAAADRATIIAFLLEHQLHFIHDEEIREAASHICLDDLNDELITKLQDAYTRCGMSDVTFSG